MLLRAFSVLLTLGLFAAVAAAQAQGPIPVRNQESLNALVLQLEPEAAGVLASGRALYGYRLDLANNLIEGAAGADFYAADHEIQRHTLSCRRGLGGGWEAAASLAYTARDGGALDNLISWWHGSLLRVGDLRDIVPRRRNRFVLRRGSVTVIDERRGAGAITALTLQAKRRLPIRAPRLALAGRVALKIPVSGRSRLLDNGALDTGFGLLATYYAGGRLWLHGNIGYVLTGTGRVGTLDGGRRVLLQSVLAAEYALDGKTRLLAQVEDNPAPFRTRVADIDARRQMITIGLWHALSPAARAFLSFSEGTFQTTTTPRAPDFTLSGGITFHR